MFSMGQSWMNNNGNYKALGTDYMFSKRGSYSNNCGSGNYNNMSSDMNNMNNWSIVPPSGDRRGPSRPAFANRYSNYSNGIYSQNGNYSNGNYSNGMRGSRFGAMYDDGFSGPYNRYDNYSFGDRYSSGMYGSGMYNRFNNNSFGDRFGSNYGGGMYGSRFGGGAMYDDGFSGMYNRYNNNSFGDRFGSNYGGMYGSRFGGGAMYDDGMYGSKYGGMSNGGMSNMCGSYRGRM